MRFNPRPSLLTGETSRDQAALVFDLAEFQSTPVIADGRDLTAPMLPTRSRSFNPRPSLLTGETVVVRCH